ncbi:MAG: GNAT family N-acetyltransferase [Gammaproteobacteria bacterium]|nr:GNAT family N-acetyltransferase [Gammaproteobacteria bacterium]
MTITKADIRHVKDVAHLFNLYRQFYGFESDIELANRFIEERIRNDESSVFIATENGETQGFVQLYPSFCSVEAVKIYILYDLYVEESYRKLGVGEALMNKATQWAKENNAARLDLLTAKNNIAGQSLYEKLGYKKVLEDFHAYSLDAR